MTDTSPRAEVSRIFDAPCAMVWRAWTDPSLLAKWWGPAGFTTPRLEADPCVGGAIHLVMRAPGGQEHSGIGAFVEMEEPRRLVFEMGPLDEFGNRMFTALHTVLFEDLGKQTRVSITVTVPDPGSFQPDHFQNMGSAWNEFFNRLEVLVAVGEGAHKMVAHRAFNASKEQLWRAWTDSAQLAKWWGPKGFTNPRCEVELRPGGAIHIDMTAPDGSVYPMGGEVVEVQEPNRFVFLAGSLDEAGNRLFTVRNTVSFDKMGDQTLVTVLYQVLDVGVMPPEAFGGADEGMSTSLDKLEALVDPIEDGRVLVFTRSFKAPRAKVWKAWTSPDLVGHWWGPTGFTTTIRSMEVREGGVWDYTMHGPDGTDYQNAVSYLEVRPTHRLVYDHGTEVGAPAFFRVRVLFEEVDNTTTMQMRMIFPSEEVRDQIVKNAGAIDGNRQTMDRLEAFLEEM